MHVSHPPQSFNDFPRTACFRSVTATYLPDAEPCGVGLENGERATRYTYIPAVSEQTSRSMPWTSTQKAVHAQIQVLDLVNGHIPIPPKITHVVLEVGCNGHDLQWDKPLPIPVPGIESGVPIVNQSHVLLISFEPLLDKYALYLSKMKHAAIAKGVLAIEHPTSPGWSVPGRAIVLPFAVGGPPDADADLNVARSDGCSSLLRINASEARR